VRLIVCWCLLLAACGSSNIDAITEFSFTSATNPTLADDVNATFDMTSIRAVVAAGTDVTSLVATFQAEGTVSVAGTEQVSGETPDDLPSQVTDGVASGHAAVARYTVTVTARLDAITAFSFRSADNPGLDGDANGSIVGGAISVVVPYQSDITSLAPSFTTNAASVLVDGVAQTSGSTRHDFTSPVTYTAVAPDGTTKDYQVSVTLGANAAKDLSSFTFTATNNTVLAVDVDATISGTTVTATVPHGTDVAALVPTFTTTGASVAVGATVQTSGVSANNFASPVAYTVTAADGSEKTYTVTVRIAPDISSFVFSTFDNPQLSAYSPGTISGTSIALVVPYQTNVTALKARYTTSGATVVVGGIGQTSGDTPNNFTNTVTYTVIGADGATQDYLVTVTIAKNSARDINSFVFTKAKNPSLATDLAGTIDGTSIAVPFKSGTNLTSLVATFTTSGVSVVVGSTPQTSGTTANNFTSGVTYTVTADDGSTKNYTITPVLGIAFDAGTSVSSNVVASSLAVADINADSKPDLVLSASSSNKVSVLLDTTSTGSTTPAFATPALFTTDLYPAAVAIADFNADGKLDMVTPNACGPLMCSTHTISVLTSTTSAGAPSATFAARLDIAINYQPAGVVTADFNGDGKPDLALTDSYNHFVVLLNTTTGATPTFSETDLSGSYYATDIAVADINGDGKSDLLFASSSYVAFYINTTATNATTPTFAAPGYSDLYGDRIAVGDLNGDGKCDVVATNNEAALRVVFNTTSIGATTPSFASAQTFATGLQARGVETVDLDGDGKLDLITANIGGSAPTISILRNTTAPSASTATFSHVDLPIASYGSLRTLDINADGKLDLALLGLGGGLDIRLGQ